VAINVGTSTQTVKVEMFGLLSSDSDTCTVHPNDLNSNCQVALNDMAFCKVTAPSISNIRAVMMNRSTASPFTIFATVEAH
jgi:hypothetical protein